MEKLHHSLFLWINAAPDAPQWLIRLAVFEAEYMPGILFSALAAYLLLRRRKQPEIWAGVLISIALAMTVTYLLRKAFYVPRPFVEGIGTNFLRHSAASAFPSKHGTPVFAVAWYLWLNKETRTAALVWLPFALAVAWSRIYLGVHWPLDMLGSVMVAFAAACCAKYLMRKR